MVALIIIGVIVGIITLIMLIPVGADVAYENSELKISAKACGVLMPIYPKPPVEEKTPKKPKKEKKPKEVKEEAAKEKKPMSIPNFNKEELLELAQAGIGAVGRFGRKLKVERFLLHYTAAGYDPYNTAMTYGYVNAALSTLAPMCRERFQVKKCSVRTDIDFTRDVMQLDFGLAMTIRIGQMAAIGIGVGIKALKILLRNKKRIKAEEALNPPEVKAEEAAASQETQSALPAAAEPEKENPVNTADNKEKENIQAEERNDSNG